MSHVTQPRIQATAHAAPARALWIAALLALAAIAAVTLVLALGDSSSSDGAPAAVGAQPSLRSDGGPEESGVAGTVGAHQSAPDESRVAAAIAGR